MRTCNAVTPDQLLSMRDAQPMEAYVAQHVTRCAVCTHEVARLGAIQSALQALPIMTAPPYDSTALQTRAALHSRARRYRLGGMTAIAASVSTIAVLLMIATPAIRTRDTVAVAHNPVTPAAAKISDAPVLASLVVRSQDLESRLRRLPTRPHVERASTTTTIDSLQNRIQWVDYQLSLASNVGLSERQAMQLWQNRIQLMDTLVKVRYAEAQRFAVLQ